MYCMGDRNMKAQNATCKKTFSRFFIIALSAYNFFNSFNFSNFFNSLILLVADGLNGIHVSGFLGRNVAEEHANAHTYEE